MAGDSVILVSGFGRCGSSLVMQMLHAGGIPGTGAWPSFEDARAGHDTFDPQWVARQHGRAVKLLDPASLVPLLPAAPYRVVWLDRDSRQQARSHAKFLTQVQGVPLSRAQRRGYERCLRADRAGAVDALRRLGPLLRLRFEDLLTQPMAAAEQLAAHTGAADVDAMARAVRPRSSAAAPDFDLELSLAREAAQ